MSPRGARAHLTRACSRLAEVYLERDGLAGNVIDFQNKSERGREARASGRGWGNFPWELAAAVALRAYLYRGVDQ